MKKFIFIAAKLPLKAVDHLFGSKYSTHHKMLTGLFFMLAGVFISLVIGEFGGHTVKFACDGFGYLLHGAGCTPFIEHFNEIAQKD